MSLKFIFVRHGEAEHNVAFHVNGDSAFSNEKYRDAPLTEKGREQAQKTAKELQSYAILDIWCSPLTRCLETAEEIFEEVNCHELYIHDALLERQGGNHVCNIRKSKREIYKKYCSWIVDYLPEFGPLWVERESTLSVFSRMYMFLQYLNYFYRKNIKSEDDRYIVLVSHKDAIECLTGKSLANAETAILTLEEILQLTKK